MAVKRLGARGGSVPSTLTKQVRGRRPEGRYSSGVEVPSPTRRVDATERVEEAHTPSRKSETLRFVSERPSKTADVPSPRGDCVLTPTQTDAG
jgi:hypothetical protein